MRSPVLFLVLCCAAAMAQTQPASTSNPAGKPATVNSQSAATPTAGETPRPQKPASDAMPATVIFDKSAPGARSTTTDGSDPLFEPPPLPKGNVSLIGGTVRSIDRVKNRINV